ncbi:uncharacterized protein LOC124931992 [Impatiens glandulifera]|uniref:uncharacterized protein LOC124931992 n=1 Tax=Impatiens glandulifera TaxID=253017 RepID=UPI001FB0A5BC|nr:uncharacterized protein LOC124931992 [Impatiens glandulifera]
MARPVFSLLHFLALVTFISSPNFLSLLPVLASIDDRLSTTDSYWTLFHQDYSPPSPPPPPPHPPSLSCEDDLGGVGSVDSTCQIVSDLVLTHDVYIEGKGNFYILPNVSVYCSVSACQFTVNVSGNFVLGENASIVTSTFDLGAYNASFLNGSLVNTTALAGSPPTGSSGTPQGVDGAGGGHGGRGACCLTDEGKLPEDVWGGDTYSWSTLQKPWSYGSKGGTTSKELDYGGGGGGRIMLLLQNIIQVNGSLLADGGDGGHRGGGGSGGSIYIKAYKMTGSGRISACGGNGFSGGGGGRVAVDIFSRHDDPEIFAHGGSSLGCPENAGAAGTFYDAISRSLTVSNHNMSTDADTLLMDFPNQPLMTNVYIQNHAKAAVPLLWSRVQVQGQISILTGGTLSFGLAHYALSEFEVLAEELLMSESVIKVYGALRMSVKMFLMWNSTMLIDGGGDADVATSLLEASNLIVLKESSLIHSNANLGVHGQGFLNLSGPGDFIEAQRLVLSLFYSIHVGPGSVLRGPLQNASTDAVTPKLNCEHPNCPFELLHPPEDCNVNSSLSFTLQVCRVEDIIVEGLIEGSVVHFHRARTIAVQPFGVISSSGMGCTGGVGRGTFLNYIPGSGGGHGGKGGLGCYNNSCVEGGISYGNQELPCELGSGSGNDSFIGSTTGGGVIVMGSKEHPLSSLTVEGSVTADGESYREDKMNENMYVMNDWKGGAGGGSGGSILLFLQTLSVAESGMLSSIGGHGSTYGGGGGGGGRIHFHWSDIPSGDVYQSIASVNGSINSRGGLGADEGGAGESGTVTGKSCPKGLYGIFCEECPAGTYKNVTGSDTSLCLQCPAYELPIRAIYISVRGGVAETPCPYKCVSDRYHLPLCYTALEELIYTFGGPWLFGFLLLALLILLALVLSVARMKFISVDEISGPAPTQHGSQIDHSFPFLESLNEVLETNRVEESRSHVHRMYFLGPNTFSEPWHFPHNPPEQVKEIVYEGEFNRFVDEMNAIASYQWWEGSVYSILCMSAYPLAWSWLQWRRKIKLQRLREFVRSEYDHACLRSCRSRALYEGLKVAATSDLMLAYVDFFLGGDEKRSDLPPQLRQRFPMSLPFGGNGSYMSPFSLHNDNIITSLMSQCVPPTTWYRFVAGLNAQLRLVRRGHLRVMLQTVINWLDTHANPALRDHGVLVDLAWFQATSSGYCQYGLLVYAIEGGEGGELMTPSASLDGASTIEQEQRSSSFSKDSMDHLRDDFLGLNQRSSESLLGRSKKYVGILDIENLKMVKEKMNVYYPLSYILHNTRPVGHQDLVGLIISILLLGDFSLVLLTLLQLYSISLADVFVVLFVLPLGILLPFPAGINALFSHGPRRSSALARVYALWNVTSLVNVVVAFICGYAHYTAQSSKRSPSSQPWSFSMDESEWWMFPVGLVLCKLVQSRLVNWHIGNLEIQDRSLYSNDYEMFWQS